MSSTVFLPLISFVRDFFGNETRRRCTYGFFRATPMIGTVLSQRSIYPRSEASPLLISWAMTLACSSDSSAWLNSPTMCRILDCLQRNFPCSSGYTATSGSPSCNESVIFHFGLLGIEPNQRTHKGTGCCRGVVLQISTADFGSLQPLPNAEPTSTDHLNFQGWPLHSFSPRCLECVQSILIVLYGTLTNCPELYDIP